MNNEEKNGVQESGEVLDSDASVSSDSSEQLANESGEVLDSDASVSSDSSEQLANKAEVNERRAEDGTVESEDPDVLDASPVSRRRSVFVLTSMAILFAMAVGVIIWMPPLSWTPEKSKADSYQALTTVTEVSSESGKVGEHTLAYQLVTEDLSYRVGFEQSIQHVGGHVLRTVLSANVTFSRPERRETEDTVAIRLSEVDVHVFDGEQEVKLSGSGGMLEGVDMYSRLGQRDGLVSVVPDSNINPQVARVLFVLLDGMRSVWLPLPSQQVSAGDSWTWSDLSKVEADIRKGRTTLKSVESDGSYVLEYAFDLLDDPQGKREKLGEGQGHMRLNSGVLSKASYEATRQGGLASDGATGLTLKVSVERMISQ